jgi:signal transduction histidine kinase
MSKTSKTYKILIVEDSMGDAMLLTHMLSEVGGNNFNVTYVHTVEEVKEFQKAKFNIILLDLHLSDLGPIETFQMVQGLFPKVPIVVLTGIEDDKLAVKIVRLGAQDYLIKGRFDGAMLLRAIRYSIERKKAQLKIAKEKVKSKNLRTKANQYEEESHRLADINKAKDIFLSVASHQLRTPATVVKQHLGMALEGYAGNLSKEAEDFIRIAYDSNERQLRIVDELLSIARLEAGKVKLKRKLTQLDNLIHKIIEDQKKTFEKRNQNVLCEFLPQIEPLEIDPEHMRMVFENLLDNASKYSPSNSDIKVKVYNKEQKIYIDFKDEGIGISDQDKSKLFNKFSRVGNSFQQAPNGSGLGLYWAREIVKLHNGVIKLVSQPGRGSVFTVVLPIR